MPKPIDHDALASCDREIGVGAELESLSEAYAAMNSAGDEAAHQAALADTIDAAKRLHWALLEFKDLIHRRQS